MFETSMVLAPTRPVRSRVGLLTASVAAHTAVIIGALAVGIASTDFPETAPNESAIYVPVGPPPPLGNPNGGAPPKPAAAPPAPQKQQTAPPPPTEITAPADVPNETPIVEAPSGADDTATGPAGEGDGTVPGPIGVPWGDPNGVGPIDAPPAPINSHPVEEKIYTPGVGDVKPPVLIQRVDPAYPEMMRKTGLKATVVVKCVIDKNGRVRDPEIVLAAMPPFNDAVLKAIKQWRYQPGSLRGNAVETYLHLTVTFSINR